MAGMPGAKALGHEHFDPQAKQLLLTRAQEWLKLAYSNSDAEFQRILLAFNAEFQRILLAFNKEQMAVNKEHIAVAAKAPPGTQRTAVQQQPAQQQQSKIQPDENGSCEQ